MLSVIVNMGILLLIGFATLQAQTYRKEHPIPAVPVAETAVMIFPEISTSPAKSEPATPERVKPSFARTSDDQTATPPANAAFIGERDTQATSDRSPDVSAPPLPSQAGIAAKDPDDLETTQSHYQDGGTSGSPAPQTPERMATPAAASPSDPALANHESTGEKTITPGNDDIKSTRPPKEELLAGPNPVDVPVPQELPEISDIKPTPAKLPKNGTAAPTANNPPAPAANPHANDPAFRGYQRKTAITGSISRTGRSALDVVDSPLGRYQAVISRAVEQEWQRNCVRHRDFITPGFLTVRFFVETSGKVRTVQFVGEMETGEVQKGFTLNSIRDAAIPPMPVGLKKDFAKEPLELIFNFYF